MADSNPFVGFLRKAFPFISVAAGAGGPLGSLAAAALGKALGADVKSDPASIATALTNASANPDQLLAAQKAEEEFQASMQKMGFDHVEALEEIAAGDRVSARNREIQVKDKTPAIGFYLITLGFFGILGYLLKYDPPAGSRDILNIMLGSLGTAWITAVAYYYGSSAGSAAKDVTISNQSKK